MARILVGIPAKFSVSSDSTVVGQGTSWVAVSPATPGERVEQALAKDCEEPVAISPSRNDSQATRSVVALTENRPKNITIVCQYPPTVLQFYLG